MSDPRTKAERSHAKDIRQGIVDQRPVTANKKKKKKWIVRADWKIAVWRRETVIGRYATLDAATKAAAAAEKSFYTNVRIEEL